MIKAIIAQRQPLEDSKMRLPLFALVFASAALLGGCNFFNRGSDTDVADAPTDEPAPAVIEDADSDGGDLPTPAQTDFNDPVVPAEDAVTVIAPDLIQSTNPNERAIGVQRSRPDPFASLPIPPTPPEPVVAPTTAATAPRSQATAAAANQGGASAGGARPSAAPTVSRPASSGGAAAAAARPSTPSAGGSSTTGSAATVPTVAAANPATPLPPVPQPTTAQAVRVSGIVQIGGEPYAIVQVQDEVERYVRAGERIARGRVLVKRIDTRSVEPRVVLEENGIEVVTNVTSGSSGVAAEPPTPPSDAQASLVSSGSLAAPGL